MKKSRYFSLHFLGLSTMSGSGFLVKTRISELSLGSVIESVLPGR